MSEAIIQIENLSKVYKIYQKPTDRLKESIIPFNKHYHKEFHALDNISLNINKGDTVGIVGVNGSGKSTLLKIITGVVSPTKGTVNVKGKVAAILELGAGFNPEYTGVENIYLNGMIMGYTRDEIDAKLNNILSFAEIGDFIYQQVKTYSSGMFARLAFAVAINVEPDILIVDEALSVGDTKFQIKCIDKMKEIQGNGTTILFVSHATEQIKRFCTKAIWLEKGKMKLVGSANDIVNMYTDSLHLKALEESGESCNQVEVDNQGKDVGFIESVTLDHNVVTTFDNFKVTIRYTILVPEVPNFLLGVAIYDRNRNYIFGPNTFLDNIDNIPSVKGTHTVEYIIPKIPLLSGTYFIDTGIFTDKGLVVIDYQTNAQLFSMQNEYFTEGLVHLEHKWRVVE